MLLVEISELFLHKDVLVEILKERTAIFFLHFYDHFVIKLLKLLKSKDAKMLLQKISLLIILIVKEQAIDLSLLDYLVRLTELFHYVKKVLDVAAVVAIYLRRLLPKHSKHLLANDSQLTETQIRREKRHEVKNVVNKLESATFEFSHSDEHVY